MQIKNFRGAAAGLAGLIMLLPRPTASTQYDWPQFNGNEQHSGNNVEETLITPANVGQLTQQFHISLPDVADGAPAYLSGVPVGSTVLNLLFLTTRDGHILALDAHTGHTVWSHQYGPGTCVTNNSSDGVACYTTSSPAVDPNRQYVYSYGLDGKVHKYEVSDGTEVIDTHWPEVVTLKGFDEKESAALSIATADDGTSYLYIALSGYPGYAPDHQGDEGDYQGHITTVNLESGAQTVFNTVCSDQTVLFVEKPGSPDCPSVQAAVWGRPGVVYDPDTDEIYFTTGNGAFAPQLNDWGDSVLALNPDGTGMDSSPLDSYTPTTFQQDAENDLDLGSTSPVILPPLHGSPVPHLGLQSGKDGILRLLNLDNLSDDPNGPQPGNLDGAVATLTVPQGGEVHTQPAVWTNPADGSIWVFVTTETQGASAIKVALVGGMPTLIPVWVNKIPGVSPLIANGVVYYAGEDKVLYAFAPLTGKQLWSAPIGSIHWESPIVANGWVYVTDTDGFLTGFSLDNTS